MTQYLNKSFSVQLGGEKYRDGWDRIFGTCGSAAEPLICNETDAGSTPAGCSEPRKNKSQVVHTNGRVLSCDTCYRRIYVSKGMIDLGAEFRCHNCGEGHLKFFESNPEPAAEERSVEPLPAIDWKAGRIRK